MGYVLLGVVFESFNLQKKAAYIFLILIRNTDKTFSLCV